MTGVYIFIVSLFLLPIVSLIIFKKIKTKTRLNRLIILIALTLLISWIILNKFDISFIQDTTIFIWASVVYSGVCYLLLNIVFRKEKVLKILGIIISVLVFVIGGIIGYAGTGVLDNEETHPPITKNFDKYHMTIYIQQTESFTLHRLILNKHYGPFKKTILEKVYMDNFPGNYSNLEFDFNKTKLELYINSYSSLSGETEIIWQDTIVAK